MKTSLIITNELARDLDKVLSDYCLAQDRDKQIILFWRMRKDFEDNLEKRDADSEGAIEALLDLHKVLVDQHCYISNSQRSFMDEVKYILDEN